LPLDGAQYRDISPAQTNKQPKRKTKMIKKANRIPSIQTQAINPNKIQKKPRQKLIKISSYVNKKQQTHKNLT
jgi:hypothetical protein